MATASPDTHTRPVLPSTLTLPLRALPALVHNTLLVTTLNKIFSDDLKNGELDFLEGKVMHISIEDAGLEYRLSLQNNRLVVCDTNTSADLSLQGNVYDYLLLASRQEDTDTLFFNRHLHIQGDTELGLYVKNYLDGMDMTSHKLSAHLERFLQKCIPVYEHLF